MHRQKYYNHTRLFVGGLPPNTKEDEVRDLFGRFGEIIEVYVHDGKGFAKIRYASKDGPERAIEDLGNREFKGRMLRIRHAVPPGAVTIKNIPEHVTNEILEKAFSEFGDAVERAVVYVDEKGVATGEGVVEFSKKATVQNVIRRCQEGCFIIGLDPIPVTAEVFDFVDTEGGMNEAGIFRSKDSAAAAQVPPHFADRYKDPVEYDYAMRWKAQTESEEKRRKDLEAQIRRERDSLLSETRQAMRDSRDARDARRREDESRQRQEDDKRWHDDERQRQYRERPGNYGPPRDRSASQSQGGGCGDYDQRDSNYGPPPASQGSYGPPPPSAPYDPHANDSYYGERGYDQRPAQHGPPPPRQSYPGGYGEYDQGPGPDRGYGPPSGDRDRYAPYQRGPRGPPPPQGGGPPRGRY